MKIKNIVAMTVFVVILMIYSAGVLADGGGDYMCGNVWSTNEPGLQQTMLDDWSQCIVDMASTHPDLFVVGYWADVSCNEGVRVDHWSYSPISPQGQNPTWLAYCGLYNEDYGQQDGLYRVPLSSWAVNRVGEFVDTSMFTYLAICDGYNFHETPYPHCIVSWGLKMAQIE